VVIAECVYVLSPPHLYHHIRKEVEELLTPIVQIPHLETQSCSILLQALHLYGKRKDLVNTANPD
jgi:hypothetical protein